MENTKKKTWKKPELKVLNITNTLGGPNTANCEGPTTKGCTSSGVGS